MDKPVFRRNGEGFGELSDREKEFVKELDGAVNKNVKESVLYRSVDAKVIFGDGIDFENLRVAVIYGDKGKYYDDAFNKANKAIGKTLTEKGYMSTTTDSSIAEDFQYFTGAEYPVVMKIKTAKTTKGADISKASKKMVELEKEDAQKEVLLARGQKYTVTRLYNKNNQIYVDVVMK